jgi:hypothetical protein
MENNPVHPVIPPRTEHRLFLFDTGHAILYKVDAWQKYPVGTDRRKGFSMNTFKFVTIAMLLALPAVCCSADNAVKSSDTALPKGHPSMAALQEASAPLTGKVLKTMDSGGYTYIYLQKKGGRKIWVAFPKTKVVVGKKIELVSGEEFKHFESKTLHRTFDAIIFSLGPVPKKGAKTGKEPVMATPGSKGATVAAGNITVVKAAGPNAHTVAELFALRKSLEGQKVTVRGKIVKVVPRIMKMNWIHIQDGTGSAGKKDQDLVVKTKALPNTGDTVTVTGTLLKDKDYGSGYKYDVLVDDAEIVH